MQPNSRQQEADGRQQSINRKQEKQRAENNMFDRFGAVDVKLLLKIETGSGA
jgi:hypothetical protein